MAKKNELVSFSGHLQAVSVGLSSRLEKRGTNIVAAIAQLAQSGSETALDKISDILAALACVFRVPVNYDDARCKTLTGPYTYVNPHLKLEHFPINGKGKAEVTFGYLEYDYEHEPTTQEVLDDIERDSGIHRPDRAETESFLDAHPEQKDKYPVIGLCGSIVSLYGPREVAYADAYESRRRLSFSRLDDRWNQRCRFLVVCKPARLNRI